MKLIVTVIIICAATALLLTSALFLPKIHLTLHNNAFINSIAKYQILVLATALFVLLLTIWIQPQSSSLLRLGDNSAIAGRVVWMGISGKNSWKKDALPILISISTATAIFMYLAVNKANSLSNFNWSFVPVIIIFAATNAFSEEIIFRFGINGMLTDQYSKSTILVTSAVLFGLAHYSGSPGGPVGIIMAGILGYLLSQIVYETRGLGLAWFIHFVQDVIIYTALMMINVR
ncbi:MAG: CPBP family intramembrane glutamic endopeptidase [Bacteroidota bacterium]|jgi:membrane protease YdiL (CAAX protease family)